MCVLMRQTIGLSDDFVFLVFGVKLFRCMCSLSPPQEEMMQSEFTVDFITCPASENLNQPEGLLQVRGLLQLHDAIPSQPQVLLGCARLWLCSYPGGG